MSANIVVSASNVSKSFCIAHAGTKPVDYISLRDTATDFVSGFFSKKSLPEKESVEEFWALNNVNFEVSRGERFGIIGRNGAGKSTLLKILSRITEPTSGRIVVKGRLSSLLEVGTGFHAELTGRENIFLNGAILGMSKQEINKKFDAIVDFSEVEQFLDTPVKRYSSGMYVKLAFSVAAHLETDVLVIDEVLSVGDVQFQKKCLARMEQNQNSGQTIIFVSHNMSTIRELCSRVIVLKSGRIAYEGLPGNAIDSYMDIQPGSLIFTGGQFSGHLAESIAIQDFKINNFVCRAYVSPCDEIEFNLSGVCKKEVLKFRFSISLSINGVKICTVCDVKKPSRLREGGFRTSIKVPPYFLRPGVYMLSVEGRNGDAHSGETEWVVASDVASLEVLEKWDDMNDLGVSGVVNAPHVGSRDDGISKF